LHSGEDKRITCRTHGPRFRLRRGPAILHVRPTVLPYHLYGSIPASSSTFPCVRPPTCSLRPDQTKDTWHVACSPVSGPFPECSI